MSRSTQVQCRNCDERWPAVASDGTTSARLNCPDCGEPVVVTFED